MHVNIRRHWGIELGVRARARKNSGFAHRRVLCADALRISIASTIVLRAVSEPTVKSVPGTLLLMYTCASTHTQNKPRKYARALTHTHTHTHIHSFIIHSRRHEGCTPEPCVYLGVTICAIMCTEAVAVHPLCLLVLERGVEG